MTTQGQPVATTTASLAENPPKSGDSVKVGLLHSLSGTTALSERPLLDAELMAMDEINGSGGILGRRLEPVVADGASRPELFAQGARELLAAGVSALFGCWSSASRKAVRPLVEAADNLLWYPVPYEGLEESPCICYTGCCLHQLIMPTVDWAMEQFGNRIFLIGSDSVFSRTANRLIRSLVASHGGSIVGERYALPGGQDLREIIADVRQTPPSAVINTLDGDNNVVFYRQYSAAGLLPAQIPVVATSVTEPELEPVATAAAGHFFCGSYFPSLDTQENRDFVRRFQDRYGAGRRVSAGVVTAYTQLYLWKQAVERAGSFNAPAVRGCLPGCGLRSPMGEVRIEANRHCSMPVRIGRLERDGQFEIVRGKDDLIAPLPWLGVENMDFPAKAMVLQSLAAFSEGEDSGYRLEREVVERKAVATDLEKSSGDLRREATEHQRAQEELRESENRLRQAVEAAKIGLWDWDLRTNEVIYSAEWKRQIGYEDHEISNDYREWESRVHPDDLAPTIRQVRAFIEGYPFGHEVEFRFRHKDGSYRWILTQASILADAQGKPHRMLGSHVDITERKRAEEALRAAEAKYRTIVESEPECVKLLDREGRLLEMNPAGLAMIQATMDQVRGHRAVGLVADEDRAAFNEMVEAVFRGETRHLIFDMIGLGGRRLTLETTSVPLKETGPAGGVKALLGVTRDITERKRAAQEVQAARDRARQQRSALALLAVNHPAASGDLAAVVRRLTEVSASVIQVQRASIWLFAKMQEELRCLDLFEAGAGRHSEGAVLSTADYPRYFQAICSDSRIFAADARTDPRTSELDEGYLVPLGITSMLDAGILLEGELAGVLCLEHIGPKREWHSDEEAFVSTIAALVAQALSNAKRKQAEESLRQAQKMESVGRLAGGVAHDFNNMLQAILGNTDLALQELPPDSLARDNLTEIQACARRSADLTRQLLAFARKQAIAPKVLDLNETLEGLLKMLRRLIGENIELLWRPAEGLWPVRLDLSQVDQMMTNLCVNARDAIANVGRIVLETENCVFDEAWCVEHTDFAAGEYVRLSVADDGCGMDPETLSHLFEPFFTTKEVGKGTGLGLATVYGAVRQNGGFVHVQSQLGQGTTLSIYLPRHTVRSEPGAAITPLQVVEHGHETILLVEDEPAILRLSRKLLERLGYLVLTAASPGEAIRLAQEYAGEIHLLITDVVMPEMNGSELARNLLTLHPNLKRLFMSGYTAEVIAHHGVLEAGVEFLQKPFSSGELAAKVRDVLDEDV